MTFPALGRYKGGVRLGLMLLAFVVLTALGIAWAVGQAHELGASWRALGALGVSDLVLVLALALAVIGAEVVRFVVIGRTMRVRVPAGAAVEATIAGNLFSWISPGAVLGEPAAIAMLGRRGVPWDAAMLISLAKFATSFLVIIVLAVVCLALGHGPDISPAAVVPLVGALLLAALVKGVLLVGAFWPDATRRHLGRLEGWLLARRPLRHPRLQTLVRGTAASAHQAVERLQTSRLGGAPGLLAILASHLLYYGAYAALLVALAMLFGARSWLEVLPVAILYQAFTYIVPTPGASGFAEAAAGVFFATLVPGGHAFMVVLLYRALTTYLHVALGLLYLPAIGVLRSLARPRPP
jgi:uncharacterized protein (TIRG00374 family)